MKPAPAPGSHIATPRSGYEHHGIYAGNGMVIHYAGLCRHSLHRGPVLEVSLESFEDGFGYRVVESTNARFSPAQVIERARTRIGEDRYRVFSNNCEHFCTWCTNGHAVSGQVRKFAQQTVVALAACSFTTMIATLAFGL